MLSCHILEKRVQFFPSGTIQILGGGVTPFHLFHLHRKVYQLLKVCSSTPELTQLTPWKVNNIVFHFNLARRFHFEKILCNQHFSYEPELFPAALISKWEPVHVTLFSNGKGMITGVKSEAEALTFLQRVVSFLCHNNANHS